MDDHVYIESGEYLSGSGVRFLLSCVAFVANLIVLLTIWRNDHLHSQPNYLLGNLAAGDFLMATGYLCFTLFNLISGYQPSRLQCLCMLLPIVWALYVSICSIVPIAYYRVKLIKAYSKSTASEGFTEPWKLRSSLGTLWIVSCLGAGFSLINVHNGDLEVCVLTLAFSRGYLLNFFIFVTTITVMVATEYLQLLIFVLSGVRGRSSSSQTSDKWHKFVQFDPRMSRIILVMTGTFIACWIPFLTSIFYYLHPFEPPSTAKAHTITHWVHILPLLHSAINPFIYSLSEKDFRDCIWQTIRELRIRQANRWILRPRMAKIRPPLDLFDDESPGKLKSKQKWILGRAKERCYTVSSSFPMIQIDGVQNASSDKGVHGRFYLPRKSLETNEGALRRSASDGGVNTNSLVNRAFELTQDGEETTAL